MEYQHAARYYVDEVMGEPVLTMISCKARTSEWPERVTTTPTFQVACPS